MKTLLKVAMIAVVIGFAAPASATVAFNFNPYAPGEPVIPNDKAQWRHNNWEVRQQWLAIANDGEAWRPATRAERKAMRKSRKVDRRVDRRTTRTERVAERVDTRWERTKERVRAMND